MGLHRYPKLIIRIADSESSIRKGKEILTNPLLKAQEYGQSIWLDYIRRDLLVSGELKRLIEEDGLRGITVNPTILDEAIESSEDYDQEIHKLAQMGAKPNEIYERIAIEDVRMAADYFLPLYKKTNGEHGFVSLEVSPHLAYDTGGTIKEAARFWKELDRPNVMIKVPGTKEGLEAIERLTSDGINVNITLLFGLERYREVVKAYKSGLVNRSKAGASIKHINSVASFFLSRIDVLIDPILDMIIRKGGAQAGIAKRVHGQVAISSAKLAYQIYKDLFLSEGFRDLRERGGRVQRLLWASTGTKNPSYSDVKYVDSLIGPDTVNTLPMKTLLSYRNHGDPQARIEENVDQAKRVLDDLKSLKIDLEENTHQLEEEGVQKFIYSYEHLMKTLEKKALKIRQAI
jgi:transaldolase